MSDLETIGEEYALPKIWQWESESGGKWGGVNRPVAGATHDKVLPVGNHQFQLYSLATPNGAKVTILFEELLAKGYEEAEYDAFLISIEGDQFGSGFVDVNPNSKIPALVDQSSGAPHRIFESGAILIHLADKFSAFIPSDPADKAECLSWLFWQMGSAPFLGGGFGHFFTYAPTKIKYAIDRYTMEVKRQFDVLDKRLAISEYMAGDEYSIADMAIWPWYGSMIVSGRGYPGATEFLQLESYENVGRWATVIGEREAVERGRLVNNPVDGITERHSASDLDELLESKQKD